MASNLLQTITRESSDFSDFLAYIKYEGSNVERGYMDARKSADALTGLDEVVRFFVYQEEPELQAIDFELPVKVQQGSWEALIPHDIESWIKTAIGLGITTYATTALKKLAENDFKDKGFKDVFKQAFKGIKWTIKIASHIGKMGKRTFDNVLFKENNTVVGIPNDKGEILYVPYKYLKIYADCPENLFSKITKNIEENRELVIGLNKKDATDDEDLEDVRITVNRKYIFTNRDEDLNEILFPELIHSEYVELNGRVTRGNENSNTIGFEYRNHILTCSPIEGNINKYKNLLFTNCIIKGYVSRLDKEGNIKEKRPKINFKELIPNQIEGDKVLDLFTS